MQHHPVDLNASAANHLGEDDRVLIRTECRNTVESRGVDPGAHRLRAVLEVQIQRESTAVLQTARLCSSLFVDDVGVKFGVSHGPMTGTRQNITDLDQLAPHRGLVEQEICAWLLISRPAQLAI